MTNWKIYRLGDIATMKYGKLPPKNNSGQYPIWSGYRNVGSTDTYNCSKGTIIVVARGVGGTGDVKIAKEDCFLTNLSIAVNIDTDICLPQYFYYKFYLSNLSYLDSGSAQSQITIDDLKRLQISLPSLEEQRRIAGILGAIDDKIENNRRINTNLELQAQALYKQWFIDFEFPNEEGKPYKSSGGKMVDSELGQIPEGWRVGDIYKYVNVVYGAPYKSALFNERKDGNPLIRIRDLKTFSPQYYTQEILPNTEFINAGDVVAGMDAEFVPCLWMGEKGVLNQRCCKFVGKQDSISNYYVMFLVKPELEFVQSYKTGTTVSHLGKSDIDKFVVVQPPLTVIERFSKIANALLNNKANLAKENITLVTLRDTLLPKLRSGELSVDDVSVD